MCLFFVFLRQGHKTMEPLKNIRLVFGISQEALAQVLGISLSLLKMIEAEKRNLPPSALPIFLWLNSEANRLNSKPAEPENSETQDFEIELLILKKSKRQIEKEIAVLNRKQDQSHRLVQLGQGFNLQFSTIQYPSASIRMDALVYNAGIQIQYADAKTKILLQMELEGVLAKMQFLEKALKP